MMCTFINIVSHPCVISDEILKNDFNYNIQNEIALNFMKNN